MFIKTHLYYIIKLLEENTVFIKLSYIDTDSKDIITVKISENLTLYENDNGDLVDYYSIKNSNNIKHNYDKRCIKEYKYMMKCMNKNQGELSNNDKIFLNNLHRIQRGIYNKYIINERNLKDVIDASLLDYSHKIENIDLTLMSGCDICSFELNKDIFECELEYGEFIRLIRKSDGFETSAMVIHKDDEKYELTPFWYDGDQKLFYHGKMEYLDKVGFSSKNTFDVLYIGKGNPYAFRLINNSDVLVVSGKEREFVISPSTFESGEKDSTNIYEDAYRCIGRWSGEDMYYSMEYRQLLDIEKPPISMVSYFLNDHGFVDSFNNHLVVDINACDETNDIFVKFTNKKQNTEPPVLIELRHIDLNRFYIPENHDYDVGDVIIATNETIQTVQDRYYMDDDPIEIIQLSDDDGILFLDKRFPWCSDNYTFYHYKREDVLRISSFKVRGTPIFEIDGKLTRILKQ